jgi:hypothetical protein
VYSTIRQELKRATFIYFTAHKNEASVQSYTNKLTTHQSQGMSGILSENLGYDREKPKEDSVDTVSVKFEVRAFVQLPLNLILVQ